MVVWYGMYGFLDRLQENAIYCDNDCVIFIQPSAEPWPIAFGDKLGDMQSELKHTLTSFRNEFQRIMHTG